MSRFRTDSILPKGPTIYGQLNLFDREDRPELEEHVRAANVFSTQIHNFFAIYVYFSMVPTHNIVRKGNVLVLVCTLFSVELLRTILTALWT